MLTKLSMKKQSIVHKLDVKTQMKSYANLLNIHYKKYEKDDQETNGVRIAVGSLLIGSKTVVENDQDNYELALDLLIQALKILRNKNKPQENEVIKMEILKQLKCNFIESLLLKLENSSSADIKRKILLVYVHLCETFENIQDDAFLLHENTNRNICQYFASLLQQQWLLEDTRESFSLIKIVTETIERNDGIRYRLWIDNRHQAAVDSFLKSNGQLLHKVRVIQSLSTYHRGSSNNDGFSDDCDKVVFDMTYETLVSSCGTILETTFFSQQKSSDVMSTIRKCYESNVYAFKMNNFLNRTRYEDELKLIDCVNQILLKAICNLARIKQDLNLTPNKKVDRVWMDIAKNIHRRIEDFEKPDRKTRNRDHLVQFIIVLDKLRDNDSQMGHYIIELQRDQPCLLSFCSINHLSASVQLNLLNFECNSIRQNLSQRALGILYDAFEFFTCFEYLEISDEILVCLNRSLTRSSPILSATEIMITFAITHRNTFWSLLKTKYPRRTVNQQLKESVTFLELLASLYVKLQSVELNLAILEILTVATLTVSDISQYKCVRQSIEVVLSSPPFFPESLEEYALMVIYKHLSLVWNQICVSNPTVLSLSAISEILIWNYSAGNQFQQNDSPWQKEQLNQCLNDSSMSQQPLEVIQNDGPNFKLNDTSEQLLENEETSELKIIDEMEIRIENDEKNEKSEINQDEKEKKTQNSIDCQISQTKLMQDKDSKNECENEKLESEEEVQEHSQNSLEDAKVSEDFSIEVHELEKTDTVNEEYKTMTVEQTSPIILEQNIENDRENSDLEIQNSLIFQPFFNRDQQVSPSTCIKEEKIPKMWNQGQQISIQPIKGNQNSQNPKIDKFNQVAYTRLPLENSYDDTCPLENSEKDDFIFCGEQSTSEKYFTDCEEEEEEENTTETSSISFESNDQSLLLQGNNPSPWEKNDPNLWDKNDEIKPQKVDSKRDYWRSRLDILLKPRSTSRKNENISILDLLSPTLMAIINNENS